MRRRSAMCAALATMALAAMALSSAGLSWAAEPDADAARTLAEVRAVVVRDYVDPARLGGGSQDTPQALVAALDPHSKYISAAELKAMQAPEASGDGSVGLDLDRSERGLGVLMAHDGPAVRAGVQVGDEIVAINGDPIGHKTLEAAAAELQGKVGTPIRLRFVRGADKTFELTLWRERLRPTYTVVRPIRDVEYLSATALSEDAHAELASAIAAARARDVKGMILDLRNCAGGTLADAASMAQLFLADGEIVSQRGHNAEDALRFSAANGDETGGLPLVVLVNPRTSAGCEVVAAALQDHHRARLVGLPTYGAGSLQTLVPLQGGGAVRLTTAFLYRPSGAPIQKRGVWPDLLVAASQAEANAWTAHTLPCEANLPNALDAGPPVDRPVTTDPPVVPPAGYSGDYAFDYAYADLAAAIVARKYNMR